MNMATQLERILVTGGCGYIGSVLVRQLLAKGYRVRIADNLSFGGESVAELMDDPRLEFIHVDIRD